MHSDHCIENKQSVHRIWMHTPFVFIQLHIDSKDCEKLNSEHQAPRANGSVSSIFKVIEQQQHISISYGSYCHNFTKI